MLSIMEKGMSDNIVILPVHDGCLCQRKYAETVLGYFEELGIAAAENKKHREGLPIEQAKDLLRASRIFSQAA